VSITLACIIASAGDKLLTITKIISQQLKKAAVYTRAPIPFSVGKQLSPLTIIIINRFV